ncbi:hypothetical protein [Clostridium folliculivorans]|uniref:Uncharacterized protein n=1 Tax=Clostridium folliculivorans TaxID=2886038 RepID=A0A9W5Y2T6_9CLOT|nr:hypothetical protein [Clostridium folliculivorans]GKU25549.1 hypothetical protein CFOLD11_23750 [Clostridium folliculivorans]GKU28572.1 hypothetical protein CFB3_06780 [Clostridium folliculivorans]
MIRADSKVININKEFNEICKISFTKDDIILDCRAKSSNIFMKVLSEKEIGVFGDYNVYIFYMQNLDINKNRYKIKRIERTFSEVVERRSNGAIDSESLSCRVYFQCDTLKNMREENGLIYEITIFGKLDISYLLSKETEVDKKRTNESETSTLKLTKPEVWHRRLDKNYSVLEIMEMDEKSFKERFKRNNI